MNVVTCLSGNIVFNPVGSSSNVNTAGTSVLEATQDTASRASAQSRSSPKWPHGELASRKSSLQGSSSQVELRQATAVTFAPIEKRLNTAEIALAGYFLARQSVGSPITDAQDIRALKAMSASIAGTRSMLTGGRPNVAEDLQKTRYQSLYRGNVGDDIVEQELGERGEVDSLSEHAISAAAATVVQSANCDDHTRLTEFLHAPKLITGDRLDMVRHSQRDHVWSELTPSGRTSPVVGDAWCDGPPMKARDTRFASNRKAVTVDNDGLAITHTTARNVAAKFDVEQRQLDGRWRPQIDKLVQRAARELGRPSDLGDDVWSATALASPRFAAAARNSIDKDPQQAEEIARRIATDLFECDAGSAARVAPSIVAAARTLDATSSRG